MIPGAPSFLGSDVPGEMFSRDRGEPTNADRAARVFEKQALIEAAAHPFCQDEDCLLRTEGRAFPYCPIHSED